MLEWRGKLSIPHLAAVPGSASLALLPRAKREYGLVPAGRKVCPSPMPSVIIDRRRLLETAGPALGLAGLTAWLWTVLLLGRALPWQATRSWMAGFAILFALSIAWWWRYWSEVHSSSVRPRDRVAAFAWGATPTATLALTTLGLLYMSDRANEVLQSTEWHLQLIAGAALLMALLESLRLASLLQIQDQKISPLVALRAALSRREPAIVLFCLVAIGVLQGTADVSPIGDDIGKYTEAARALLDGSTYPVHQAASYLVETGMTPDSPAMPALPVLLAVSFAIFGQTSVGLVIPLAILAAIFPLALFWACRQLTGSRILAYATAILLSLFPPYQLHVLGTPVPDTLFVVLLLLVAALAVKANDSKEWKWWIATGVTTGLVANGRPEGLDFSIAIMLVLGVFHWSKRQFWAAMAAYLLVLSPFALTYHSVAGSFWPATFGGTVGLSHLDSNLSFLRYFALPWYVQAIGLSASGLLLLGLILLCFSVLGSIALLKSRPALLFIPCLGFGYVASSLFIHPLILMSYTPVDVLRHWSSGIPYMVLTLAYGLFVSHRVLMRRLSRTMGTLLSLTLIVAFSSGIYYECDRLAKPEFYFGGKASLLWTGSSYLLTDLLQHPMPLPPPQTDPKSGEEIREDMRAQLREIDLRRVNRSEPYHWTTMLVALFGAIYALAAIRFT